MDFDLNLGEWIVIGLSAFLSIWYFNAISSNRRRGLATYRWLYRSLGEIGKVSHAEWIGSSNIGAYLEVKKAAKPFRHVAARYQLEPREFLPYWLFSRMKGKREVAVIQMTLRFAPRAEFEISPRNNRSRAKETRLRKQMDQGSQVSQADSEEAQIRAMLEPFMAEYGSTVEKLTLRREAPHITMHCKIQPLLQVSAESYFKTLLASLKES